MDNKNIFASNLNYYMEQEGISRKELSEALGVSYFTLTDWANGKKFPRMDKVEALANYFGILKSDLIEKKTMESDPSALAAKHVDVITDEGFVRLHTYYKLLPEKQKRMMENLLRDMVEDDDA